MPGSAEAATAAETTLTTARQSSQLLQLLRLVLQDSLREMRRYLARGGDPHAMVYQDSEDGSFHVSSEEYTGSAAMLGMSLLAACCSRERTEQASLLIDAGADPDSHLGEIFSPMCAAAGGGAVPLLAMLLARGAAVDCERSTPLMAASESGELEAAKWLVDHGANVSAAALVPAQDGRLLVRSPMVWAAQNSHLEVMRFLLAHGAPFAATAGGQTHTALHEAVSEGHEECATFILACGLAVDTKRFHGQTALHWAAQFNRTASIELLLNSGAVLEKRDDSGHTALNFALAANRPEAVHVLLACGAIISDGAAAWAGAAPAAKRP